MGKRIIGKVARFLYTMLSVAPGRQCFVDSLLHEPPCYIAGRPEVWVPGEVIPEQHDHPLPDALLGVIERLQETAVRPSIGRLAPRS